MTTPFQPGIFDAIPLQATYLTFSLKPGAEPADTLRALAEVADGVTTVVGIGESLVLALGASVGGLRSFPLHVGKGIEVPSTPAALWCWLRGEDRGELVHRARRIEELLAPDFRLDQVIEAFRYGEFQDLTGYEDGTENPEGEEAVAAAAASDGSSFVAVQQWLHDLDRFEAMPAEQQDHTFGRRRSDNEELDDAPESAHVKRTAQESFEPEAFVVRRSMPWSDGINAGLVFVAFGASFDAYEAQLNRMAGAEDGIVDALFTFTRPLTGAYFWCPPVRDGRLDLGAVGI